MKVEEDVIVRKCAEEVTGVTLEAMLGEWTEMLLLLLRSVVFEELFL